MKRFLVALVFMMVGSGAAAQQPQTDDQRQRILDRSLPPLTPTAISPVVGATNVPVTLNEIRYEALNGSRCEVYLNTTNQFPAGVKFYDGPCTGVAAIPPAFTGQIKPGLRAFAHVKNFNTNRGNNPATFTWSFTFGSAPCTPVNCEWNDWVLGTPTGWSECVGGSQTRTRTDTRTVKTPASCGGTACAGGSTRTITETQACTVGGCTYVLSPTSQSYPASGGAVSLTMTTGAGCAWNAMIDVPWMTVSPSSGTGTGTMVGTVAANTGAARTGHVNSMGQSFAANQAAGSAPAEFTMTLNATTFTYGSTTKLVVTFANKPNSTKGDWFGLYSYDAPTTHFSLGDPNWQYADGTRGLTGVTNTPSGTVEFDVSKLNAYRYRVQLNANEDLVEVARREFTVTEAPPPTCVYSAPVFKSALTACVNGSRSELWTSTLVSGDAACAVTKDVTMTNRPCTVTQERSAFSNEVTATPAAGQTTVTVQWDPPTSGTPSFYEVYRGTASGSYAALPVSVGTNLTYSFPVTAGVPFFAAVKAVKETDVATPISIALTVPPSTAPTPPPLPPSQLEQDVKELRTAIMETMIKDYEQGMLILDSTIKRICRRVGPTGQLQCVEASQVIK